MNGFFQQNLLLKLNIVTGVDFQLQEFLYYNSVQFGQLRTMTSSDGISVPRLFESLLCQHPPLDGGYFHYAPR